MSAAAAPVALISGSQGGIGVPIAEALRRDGFRTCGIDLTNASDVCDLDLAADITRLDEVEAAFGEFDRRFGRLDALVHTAGVNLRQPFLDMDIEQAKALFEVNVWGTVNLTRASQERLCEGSGAMVVLTSINGELGIGGGAAYGMSKSALGSLVRVLAVEWAHIPVRVNAVSPAIVPTAMNQEVRSDAAYLQRKLDAIPYGRMIEPEEVAEAVAFLASDRSSGITGDVLHLDGGATIVG